MLGGFDRGVLCPGLTLGLAAGASVWEGAVLGNLAASIVVRQFGTTTTTVQEMRAALLALFEKSS